MQSRFLRAIAARLVQTGENMQGEHEMEYRYQDLILRDFKESDIDSMLHWFTGHHPWMDWDAPWEPVQAVDAAQYRAESMKRIAAEKSVPRWSLQIELDGAHIGYVSSYRIGEDFDDVSDEEAKTKPWYRAVGLDILNDACWGKGYGTMALEGWLHYLLENGVSELYLQTWSGNTRMIHVAEKLGFAECSRRVNLREWQGRRYDALSFRLDVPTFLTFCPTGRVNRDNGPLAEKEYVFCGSR